MYFTGFLAASVSVEHWLKGMFELRAVQKGSSSDIEA